jgi:hypothetical protein
VLLAHGWGRRQMRGFVPRLLAEAFVSCPTSRRTAVGRKLTGLLDFASALAQSPGTMAACRDRAFSWAAWRPRCAFSPACR